MQCFAEERFRFQARVSRVFGCFFVSRAWYCSFEDYEAEFSIAYAAYVVLMTVVIITYELFMIFNILTLMTSDPSFFEKLYIVLHFIVAIKVIVNFVVLNFNTPTIVAALKAVKRLELSINFRFQDDNYFWMKERLRIAVFAATLLALSLCRCFAAREVTENMSSMMAFFITTLSTVFTMFYGVIGALVLLLEKYFCVVLSRFVKFQAENTKQLLSSRHPTTGARDLTRAFERLRSSLAVVTRIVWQVDRRLHYAVVANFICSAIDVCIVLYALAAHEISWGKLSFTALYAVFTAMTLVDVSLSAGNIREEVLNLKAILESASPVAIPSRLCRQMELFALTISENQFCFTGSGFFAVDKPVLTSFVAVVITHSILLVQTGRNPEARHCGSER